MQVIEERTTTSDALVGREERTRERPEERDSQTFARPPRERTTFDQDMALFGRTRHESVEVKGPGNRRGGRALKPEDHDPVVGKEIGRDRGDCECDRQERCDPIRAGETQHGSLESTHARDAHATSHRCRSYSLPRPVQRPTPDVRRARYPWHYRSRKRT